MFVFPSRPDAEAGFIVIDTEGNTVGSCFVTNEYSSDSSLDHLVAVNWPWYVCALLLGL